MEGGLDGGGGGLDGGGLDGVCFKMLATSLHISQPSKGHDLLPRSLKCGGAHIEPLVGSRECGAGH